ncbi:MAG TPA: hypothetical protein VLF88_00495 [Candidatus Babeliales bacterium]|nr:hypothetical protein [Candidatus Babeliales bacterium]
MAKPKEETVLVAEKLNQAERSSLVALITDHTNEQSRALSGAPNWEDTRAYMGLVGMVGLLGSAELDERQQVHIRMMIAFDYIALPKDRAKPPNTASFLKEVRSQAAAEIAAARRFKGDIDSMTPDYQDAFNDWDRFKDSLITDPLILKMVQSVRELRAKRSRS